VAQIRTVVNTEGPAAAAALIPRAVIDQHAVVGERRLVVNRLRELVSRLRPELTLFDAGDYSVTFLEVIASFAADVGLASGSPATGVPA